MVQAIIMAGGEGSRLRPLTCDRPKPMVPVLNRPVMEHAVELLKRHGIIDIGVTLQYMPQEIINYFGDGSGSEVNMQYFLEETPLGTAGSVKNAEGFIRETFVVVSGDALTDFDLQKALDFHRQKGALATLVLTPVDIPLEYGVVITEKAGRIRRFLEKPGWGEVFSDTVNTGIYILEPEVLEYIPPNQKFDFSKDLFPYLLLAQKPLFGVSLNGYWCDIGNLTQYLEAHFAAMDGSVNLEIQKIGPQGISLGQNCHIDPAAIITPPVVIGDRCHLGADCIVGPHVVLGSNCMVDTAASLKKSVIWSGSYIGKQAQIRGAVICNRVTVKDRASVFEGAVIGDNCVLEEDAKVRPDAKMWPHKVLEKGSVLGTHLIWGGRACRNLFGSDGISGKVNDNLTPECAAKLGAVYGSIIGPGATILVSSDNHRSTGMIKSAVQAGLMSMGVSVIDGGSLITPVHRYAINALGAKGGVHIKSAPANPEEIHVNFFSGEGIPVSRDRERKIENLFERADFQRADKGTVGLTQYMPGLVESYIRNLLNQVDVDSIRNRRFKILTYHTGDNLQVMAPHIFSGLGCEIINAAGAGGETQADLRNIAEALAPEVVKASAGMGVVYDSNGESLLMIDELGRIVDDDALLALISLMVMEKAENPVIAVPVTGSAVLELIAGGRNGRVIRTKTAHGAFLSEVSKPEIAVSQGRLRQTSLTGDALYTQVMLLDYMAQKDLSLSRILAGIPEIHMVKKETDCPWAVKGKVMRRLIEDCDGGSIELLDGVKVFHDNGWALILPDAGEPQYHVYAEGFSHEFAEELAGMYIDRINQLKS